MYQIVQIVHKGLKQNRISKMFTTSNRTPYSLILYFLGHLNNVLSIDQFPATAWQFLYLIMKQEPDQQQQCLVKL